ncbi:hypothetical protein RQP46_004133 [Phenoliferia psychrophenolica]
MRAFNVVTIATTALFSITAAQVRILTGAPTSDTQGMRLKVAEANPPGAMVDIFFRIAGDPGARMLMRRQEEGGEAKEGEKKEAGGTTATSTIRNGAVGVEVSVAIQMGEAGEGEKPAGEGEKPAGEGAPAEGEKKEGEGAPAEGEKTEGEGSTAEGEKKEGEGAVVPAEGEKKEGEVMTAGEMAAMGGEGTPKITFFPPSPL